MALLRYLRPVSDVFDASETQGIPRSVLTEVSKEVRRVEERGRKRGSYLSLSLEERTQVANYGSVHGVRAAVRHYSKELGKELKENTVRDWVKAFKKELQRKCSLAEIGDDVEVTELPCKKRGRPVTKKMDPPKMDPPSPNISKYLDPPELIFQISAEIFGPPMKLLFPPLKFMQFFTELICCCL